MNTVSYKTKYNNNDNNAAENLFCQNREKNCEKREKRILSTPKKNPEYAPKLTWNSKHEGNLTDGYGYVQL